MTDDPSKPLARAQHETFAQNIAKGMAGPDAYEASGFKTKNRDSSGAAASRLLAHVAVAPRVEWLKARGAEIAVKEAGLTKRWILEMMQLNAEIAMGVKTTKVKAVKKGVEIEMDVTMRDAHAANRALELLGRECNVFIEKKEIGSPGEFSDMSDADIRDYLAGRSRGAGADGQSAKRVGAPGSPKATRH